MDRVRCGVLIDLRINFVGHWNAIVGVAVVDATVVIVGEWIHFFVERWGRILYMGSAIGFVCDVN